MNSDQKIALSAYEIDQVARRGDLHEALDLALQAIRWGAVDSELFFVAANTAYELGHLQKAERLISLLLASDPDHIKGWVLFGRIHSRKGDVARSTYGLKRAEEIFPAVSELDIDEDAAESPFGKSAPEKVTPSSTNSISFETATFADICVRQGYLNKALKIYSDLLARNPDDGTIKQKIEEIKRKMGIND